MHIISVVFSIKADFMDSSRCEERTGGRFASFTKQADIPDVSSSVLPFGVVFVLLNISPPYIIYMWGDI